MNTQMRDCLVIGSGRMAGGFVVPLLREAGWSVTLACRSAEVRDAITGRGGIWLEIDGGAPRWIDQVRSHCRDNGAAYALRSTPPAATAAAPTAAVVTAGVDGGAVPEHLRRPTTGQSTASTQD